MRILVAAAILLWTAPVLGAGLAGSGVARLEAIGIAIALGATLAWVASPRLAALIRPVASTSRFFAVAALIVTGAAVVQVARLSAFMADPARAELSVYPDDPFRRQHSCLTSYAEAARFASEGRDNIYDASLYQPRFIGPLKVDSYHYPPPYLLVPRAVWSVADEFMQFRAVWFVFQALTLAGVGLGVALWIGGRAGAYAALGVVLVLAAPPVLFSLQQGNFQSTAVALALAGFLLLCTSRVRTGALLLAYAAAAKVFPGVLLVPLVARRNWRAVGWTAAAGTLLILLTLATFGTRPFVAFVTDELPQISDGRAFPHAELRQHAPVNQSIYGLVTRLRHLGLESLDTRRGLQIVSIYGLLVVAFAAFVGLRLRADLSTGDGRLRVAIAALALVTLASFRSPFVGGSYGLVSTLWVLTLAAAGSTGRRAAAWYAALVAIGTVATFAPSPAYPPTTFSIVSTGVVFLVVLALNVWLAFAALRPPSASAAAAEVAVERPVA